jgi:hypothetical protein
MVFTELFIKPNLIWNGSSNLFQFYIQNTFLLNKLNMGGLINHKIQGVTCWLNETYKIVILSTCAGWLQMIAVVVFMYPTSCSHGVG